MKKLNEELLGAWLRLSTSIVNPRIVSELSYNETLVCNVLYRNQMEADAAPLTATDLCNATKMLKSQMNRTLNLLEAKGLICKSRSEEDKRQVFITLDIVHADTYIRQHERILKLLDDIIARLGEEKAELTAKTLVEVADIADNILGN